MQGKCFKTTRQKVSCWTQLTAYIILSIHVDSIEKITNSIAIFWILQNYLASENKILRRWSTFKWVHVFQRYPKKVPGWTPLTEYCLLKTLYTVSSLPLIVSFSIQIQMETLPDYLKNRMSYIKCVPKLLEIWYPVELIWHCIV